MLYTKWEIFIYLMFAQIIVVLLKKKKAYVVLLLSILCFPKYNPGNTYILYNGNSNTYYLIRKLIIMNKLIRQWYGGVFLFLFGGISSVGYCGEEGALKTLRDNVVVMELAPTRLSLESETACPQAYGVDAAPVVSEKELKQIQGLIREDGSFEGIDYGDKGRSVWQVLRHLDYCRSLAIALHVFPAEILKKYDVEKNCMKSFDWWLEHKPRNPNWWNNDVYVAQMMGNIALLLDGKSLTDDRQQAVAELLKTAKPSNVGQNLMWLGWNSLLAGLVSDDEARVEKALKALSETIAVVGKGKEGIQPDMSFHQHGAQLYQGNYGRHYLHSASKFVRAVSGTPWADPQKVSLIENYLLDGTRWMCWGSLLDYSVWGRQMTYDDRRQGPDILYACLNMKESGGSRAAEVQEYAISLSSVTAVGEKGSLSGTRVFPLSDYAVHRTPSFMSSVRMSSTRTVVGEECNGDNLKGAYLSDGCMLTYLNGQEYERIFPVWDWTCIPGTTARRGVMPGIREWSGKRGGESFAGGISAGGKAGGAAGMISSRFGVTARKSWFFYPDRVVCLGSGITSQAEGLTEGSGHVLTTVEQSLLQAGVSAPVLGKKSKIVHHGGTTYVFAKETSLLMETAPRKGNWKSIRSGSEDKEEEKSVFLLAIDHGKTPDNVTYSYQVIPSQYKSTHSAKHEDDAWGEVEVLRCDEKVHAVSRKGEVKVIFYSPDQLVLPSGRKVEAKTPCFQIISSDGKSRQVLPAGSAIS